MKISDRMSNLKPSAIREILKTSIGTDIIAFSAGNPSADLFPSKELAKIAEELFEKDAAMALQYSVTEGYDPLRNQMKERMEKKYNISMEGNELIIVSGGQQGIDLAAKCVVNDGDVVVCEDPSFIGALNTFRSYNARLVGVPMDDEGMDIDRLEEVLKTEKNVKVIYTIPTFQNPMGVTLSMERRRRMYELAVKYDVLILEDSPYFELTYSGEVVPPIKTLDKTGHVLFAGSFSKIISPGIRVGFVIGPQELVSKMVVAKQGEDVHTNLFFMMAVSRYLERYDLDKHIEECRDVYRAKKDKMIECMEKYFDKRVSFTRPNGGLFIWCTLPEGCSGVELCEYTKDKKVSIVPGMAFTVAEKDCNAFRLNFSVPSMEQIEKGIALLGEAIDEYLKAKNL